MTILQAIKALQARNQSYVDRKGKDDDYSRKSDKIINAIIDFYMSAKSYENDIQLINQEITQLIDEIQKYKHFLSIFGFQDSISKIHPDFIKIIVRENVHQQYINEFGQFTIHNLFNEIENIKTETQAFLFPIEVYWSTRDPFYKKAYQDHTDFFNDIDEISDTDLQAFENIYYKAYLYCVSRLSFNINRPNKSNPFFKNNL